MQNQSTNPYGIPASEIKTVDYTNDKIFLNFSSNQRIRSNIHDYNWLINTYMEVELMAMIKGWTGAWRGLENVGGLAIHLNNLVVKRVLVPGAGADGYPSDGTYYFPNWTPVNSSSPTSITKGTVIVNGGYLTFNLFPNVVTANSGPTIYMGFIPLINAASGGTIDVLSIDLGCYGNSYGKWIGIEYKK
ncbi:MAG: hypothetical protein IPH58_08140 [Sphingobacteriales bacterium]|nr:hypothetical protein [Sphingobacteriales bacterium]